MNKPEIERAAKLNEATAQVVISRMDRLTVSLAELQRASTGLASFTDKFAESHVRLIRRMLWPSPLVAGADRPGGVVWVLIAPDFSGADQTVISYRDLFLEKARQEIDANKDTVLCVGSEAFATAVKAGMQVAFAEPKNVTGQTERTELSGFLTRMAMNLLTQGPFTKVRLLYLGPQQRVVHPLFPLVENSSFAPLLANQKLVRTPIPQKTATVATGLASVFASNYLSSAMVQAEFFAQMARYQALQESLERIKNRQRSLARDLIELRELKEQDDATMRLTQRRAVGI